MKHTRVFCLTFLLLFCFAGDCSLAADGNISSSNITDSEIRADALDSPANAASGKFALLDNDNIGVDFIHGWEPRTDEYAEMLGRAFAGGGVAIGDYDNDGRPDVYLSRPFGGGRLYRNLGNWEFQDVTQQSGLAVDQSWSTGSCFVDIDGDGDLDLSVCGYDCPNRLFVNQGDGTFVDRAKDFGLDFVGASIMMVFSDYDRDGDMDGFLVANRFVKPEMVTQLKQNFQSINQILRLRNGQPEVIPELREVVNFMVLPNEEIKIFKAGQSARLFRNNGDGTFSDVAREVGIVDNGLTLAAVWWDYDADGFPDLYVANDFEAPDRLYHNNGNGTFTDTVKDALPHVPWYSMGCNVADVNNDGLLDLIGTDMAGTTHYKSKLGMGDMSDKAWLLDYSNPRQVMRNSVYLNSGTGHFLEAAQMMGVANTDWTWAPKYADFDCDGRVDLFVSNGMTRDWLNSDAVQRMHEENRSQLRADEVPVKRDANLAYRNLGDLRFQDQGSDWGLNQETVSFGAAVGDLDNDGDLDLVVNNFDGPCHVYRNDLATGNRVKIRLRGQRSNRFGVGALVTAEFNGQKLAHYMTLARGFMACDELVAHFGLGSAEQIDRLTVRWPSGTVQQFEHLAANHTYTIFEASVSSEQPSENKEVTRQFVHSQRIPTIRHQELPYDDFKRQPLLPNRMSQLGPGIAMGDVNGDGHDDMFVGGAAQQSGNIYLHEGEKFVKDIDDDLFGQENEPFLSDRKCEDMGAVFFDAEGDGDLDLYVVSGSGEFEPGDQQLQDRLYLNNGTGDFEKASASALPELRDSGSCVLAADYDRDGDLDLFVGGRCVPGAYPTTPQSHLLRNDSTRDEPRLTEVTNEAALGLADTGMVTGGIWSDVNNDGWIDLLVTHEWGPVKLFLNEEGRLTNQTADAGLADRIGWWNGISGGDVDHDGDIDFVVTNFGLNTKYHPSHEHPVSIYYGDFDGSGKPQIVEAKHYEGGSLPIRGKSCSQNAIPTLREKFPTYHEFAIASLEEIYTPQCLNDSLHLMVDTLESGLLINDGHGHFEFRPLPRLAQIAPSFGVALTDTDGDGHLDLYLAQNFFGPQRETGRMNGGLSLLLKGDGAGNFTPVWPNQSGLVVPGDATALVVADINADATPDFLVSVNDGELQAFENNSTSNNSRLLVALKGPSGNVEGVGARVTVVLDDQTERVAEVRSGESYLSQNPRQLSFSFAQGRRPTSVRVRWPDGKETTSSVSGSSNGKVVVNY